MCCAMSGVEACCFNCRHAGLEQIAMSGIPVCLYESCSISVGRGVSGIVQAVVFIYMVWICAAMYAYNLVLRYLGAVFT